MNPETVSLLILAALAVLVCMVGYLISLQNSAKSSKPSVSAASAAGGTIHPGMSNEHFMAIIGAVTSHHRANDERLIAILTAAAAHTLGVPVAVVKFKPLNTMDWTWAVQGRVALHSPRV